MAIMGNYCKAYPASRFQEYPGWLEKELPPVAEGADNRDEEPLDDRYFFIQESFVVTDGIFLDERIVFDNVTPEWKAFCEETLEFRIPEPEPMPVFTNAAKNGGSDERISAEVV